MMSCSETNPFFMDKCNASSRSKPTGENFSVTKADSILMDCLSFLGLGLGIDAYALPSSRNKDSGEDSMLSESFVSQQSTSQEDDKDDESKTLNTRSTMEIPSSLDTRTLGLPATPPSELLLVGSIGHNSEQAVARRKNRGSPSTRKPPIMFSIERAPSLIRIFGNDDQSIVSSVTIDASITNSTNAEYGAANADSGIRANRSRAGKQRQKPKSRKNKTAPARANFGGESKEERRSENDSKPAALRQRWKDPLKPYHHKKVRGLSTEVFRKQTTDNNIPTIKATISRDLTAITAYTTSTETDDLPFDEALASSSKPIEEIRIGRLRRR